MDITIQPSALSGTVRAIPSKSFAHRMLIAAALSDNRCTIACSASSEDIDATLGCLRALGAGIEYNIENGTIDVSPISDTNRGAMLDCGESGTTLRLLLPVVCALGADAEFRGHGRLPQRPLSPLYGELVAHRIKLSDEGRMPLYTAGKLSAGKYSIRADVSSQFISGLLFALSVLSGESELKLTGKTESKRYIDMTLDVLKLFGADIAWKNEESTFFINGRGVLHSPGKCEVEGDWSNAAFWLCAGALRGAVKCAGLSPDSSQGDREIIRILKDAGADIKYGGGEYICEKADISPMTIDASDIPDLVPIIAVTAAGAIGKTVIKGASRLRIKESDRLKTVSDMLNALGGDVAQTEDGLIINGTGGLRGGTVDACGDHRIAMSAAASSCICRENVTIRGAEAVNKSYPGFFKDFSALGGNILE